MRKVIPEIIAPNHALRLKARQDLTDGKGVLHRTGEEWLVREVGAYLTGVFEEVRKLEWCSKTFIELWHGIHLYINSCHVLVLWCIYLTACLSLLV